MLGAIAGDIIGSVYEWHPVKRTDFPLFSATSRFTDDSVLTVATADALLGDADYARAYRRWARRYPGAGYGGRFQAWAAADGAGPYGSFGNGSAMRVAPVAYACTTLEQVEAEAARSAAVTHDHPEGVRGAQALASAVFLARSGAAKEAIREEVAGHYGYDLDTPLDALRPGYTFDVTCRGSVPAALRAFLEAEGYEEAVRLAVSLGGDSDTLACMAGAVAEAYWGGVPAPIAERAWGLLDADLQAVVRAFGRRHADRIGPALSRRRPEGRSSRGCGRPGRGPRRSGGRFPRPPGARAGRPVRAAPGRPG